MTSSNTRELHLPDFPVGSPTNAAPHAVVLPRSSVMGLWSYSIRHRSGRFPASLGEMSCRKVTHMTHMASLPPTCALMKGEDIWIDKHTYARMYICIPYLSNESNPIDSNLCLYPHILEHDICTIFHEFFGLLFNWCFGVGGKTRPLDHLTAVRAG